MFEHYLWKVREYNIYTWWWRPYHIFRSIWCLGKLAQVCNSSTALSGQAERLYDLLPLFGCSFRFSFYLGATLLLVLIAHSICCYWLWFTKKLTMFYFQFLFCSCSCFCSWPCIAQYCPKIIYSATSLVLVLDLVPWHYTLSVILPNFFALY